MAETAPTGLPDEVAAGDAPRRGDGLRTGVEAPGVPRTGAGGILDLGWALASFEGGLLPAAFTASTVK
jgi:hypothetical protein